LQVVEAVIHGEEAQEEVVELEAVVMLLLNCKVMMEL
tara:strand:- start:137 stop:247 length:111 start_codon:yes stop_codon:yes gene_type:complete